MPSAALAQSGGDGGAGDSQYQDPFGTSTPVQALQAGGPRAAAAAARAAADQTPAPAPTAQSAQSQPQTQPPAGPQPAPRRRRPSRGTGFDVLPVAAAGLLLLLGGLALWRRPHGER